MANEQLMAYIQSLPPEEQQQEIARLQQMMSQGQEQQPPQMPQQPVDPKMGLPGQGGLTPQQKMDSGNPNAFRDFAGEGNIISDQQKQAEALRSTATPQGVYTKNAGFVASNPLSHIASAAQRIKGGMDAKDALQAKKDLSKMVTTTQQEIAAKTLEAKEDAARKKEMEEEMRENRRGGTPMEIMAGNQNKRGYA